MNFNIYVNNQLYQELENYRQSLGKSRNSIITEALMEWIDHHKQTKWPKDFFHFNDAIARLYPNTKELRKDFLEPKEHNF
jgi:hypothetical protein